MDHELATSASDVDIPPGGIEIDAAECDRRWRPWTPNDVARRLDGQAAAWCVVGGWALDLFVGETTRVHDDIEIAVPRGQFGYIEAAFPEMAWDAVGSGRVWPFDTVREDSRLHQTWLRDAASGVYHLDVFREPYDNDRWICRFAPSITLSHNELTRVSDDGIPYATPEVVLLFKSRAPRDKDEADFAVVEPALSRDQRARLVSWMEAVSPGHPWIDRLER